MGMMAMDGDGSTQDDDAALACFRRAAKAAKAGLVLARAGREEPAELEPVEPEYRFYSPPKHAAASRAQADAEFVALLKQLMNDAEESVQSLGGGSRWG